MAHVLPVMILLVLIVILCIYRMQSHTNSIESVSSGKYGIEPVYDIAPDSDGNCQNRILSYMLPNEAVFSLGADIGLAQYLYFNPKLSIATSDDPYICYFSSSRISPEYDVMTGCDTTAEETRHASVLVGLDRTLDISIPADYRDAVNYGVRWTDSSLYDGTAEGETEFSIRIIRKNTCRTIALLRVTAIFNSQSQSYRLENLRNSILEYEPSIQKDFQNHW